MGTKYLDHIYTILIRLKESNVSKSNTFTNGPPHARQNIDMNYISPKANRPLDIAVVGSGIAGMSAAWLLGKTHQVSVYEKEGWIGGHSNTVDAPTGDGTTAVDTGFIVYNEVNYPNLVALFDHLNVSTEPTDMSFGVSLDHGTFEYGSGTLNAVIGQRQNLIRPRYWKMVSDIRKFFANARDFVASERVAPDLTLGDFIDQNGYGPDFVDRFILPMGAAIWSTKPAEMRQQPACTYLKFLYSHNLLQFKGQFPWRTVTGGSRQYVKKLTSAFSDRVKLNHAVASIKRSPTGVMVTDERGFTFKHDAVVIATHADQALTLLSDADFSERKLLGAFRYTDNHVVLHSDPALMPKRRSVWSSWNFMGETGEGVSVSYWMNKLQNLDQRNQFFVSVNPLEEPDPILWHRSFNYTHPFFDLAAWRAQEDLWSLQGRNNTWFCGSYFGSGFHEDALQSGLAVAEDLGGLSRPWSVDNESGRIYRRSRIQARAA